jgi:hypothetical protein
MHEVPRIGRILDLVGLAVFLLGAGFFAWAWMGFRSVPAYVPDPGAEPFATLRLADGYLRIQAIGGGLMLLGAGVFVAAWWVARRASRAGTAPVHEHGPGREDRPE